MFLCSCLTLSLSISNHSYSTTCLLLSIQFELPNPAGKAGGACTSAILKVLYRDKVSSHTWVSCLRKMRTELNQMGYDQIPELSSSRMIDVNRPMCIVPPGATGTTKGHFDWHQLSGTAGRVGT